MKRNMILYAKRAWALRNKRNHFVGAEYGPPYLYRTRYYAKAHILDPDEIPVRVRIIVEEIIRGK